MRETELAKQNKLKFFRNGIKLASFNQIEIIHFISLLVEKYLEDLDHSKFEKDVFSMDLMCFTKK